MVIDRPPGRQDLYCPVPVRGLIAVESIRGLSRYVAAALVIAAFLLARLALEPWLGLSVPYLQFFPAIMLVAWLVGLGPGMLATALSVTSADYFFLAPVHRFAIDSSAERVSLPLFAAIATMVVLLTESLRRSERASRDAAATATARARELDAVFEALPDGVWVGRGRRISRVNAAAVELFGAPSPEDLLVDVAALASKVQVRSPDTGRPLEPAELPFVRALSGERVRRDIVVRRLDNGEDRLLRSSAAPMHGDQGIVGAVVVNTDVTRVREAVKQLEAAASEVSAARMRLAEVVANVPGVVYEAWGQPDEASQRIDFVSDYVRNLLGYEPIEWTSKPNFWLEIVHPDDRERAGREAAAIFASGAAGRSEFRWLAKDGRVLWVEAHSNVIVDAAGRPIGMRGVTLDISARRQLETERAELFAREQAARADAVAANRLKDDFLATLSHELRTPLNAILGYARMLRRGAIAADRQPKAFEVVERNAASLAQMVEEVLDVSRVAAGKIRLTIEAIDLAGIIEDAIATVRPAADAKEVSIEAELDRTAGLVSGDAERLQQVVWHLLTNAVRFTPRGGAVRVQLRAREADVEIVVRDNGAGIDASFLPHVFERFRQADSRPSREYGGLGLGLAIARDLVELHGGAIEAASDGQGRGATLTVSVPVLPGRRAESPPPA